MANYRINKNQNNSILNREWTQQEVMHVIVNLKLNTAMAHDLMHYKLIHIGRKIIIGFFPILLWVELF